MSSPKSHCTNLSQNCLSSHSRAQEVHSAKDVSGNNSAAVSGVETPCWDVRQAAKYLKVSESWVRRHLAELPHSRHGRLIRFDPEVLKRRVENRKSLEPIRRLMPNNRYQRGGVYPRGKRERVWYGTYRIDTPEGRRPINIRLGTVQELSTKVSAREKLREKIAEMTNSDGGQQTASSMKYSELVEKWKKSEGPGLGEATLDHYANAFVPLFCPIGKIAASAAYSARTSRTC